ncbi:major royal jelly protein 1 [Stomoxys calcitrans]|uniref:major royal jelly protein 1 n=1 Tax=Stomoxys calcitrans TaxID=35570 RepID=UPI0027E21CE8|nr:major royal jelly protein 1 [Stomoxys calcitrans]
MTVIMSRLWLSLVLTAAASLLNLCTGLHLEDVQRAHVHAPNPRSSLQVVKQWKLFTYNFLPHAPTQDVNFYNPSNILATGLAILNDRIFIATPKLFSGVSSTLNWISREDFDESPVLNAYPDWSYTTTGRTDFNCSDLVLISVYRMRVDSCNRLWVLDAGISRSLEDYEKTCPPKILVFDLKTNQVVRRIDFPSGVLRGESLFTNLVIDETTTKSGTCDDVFVYISDTVEPGIVVYDCIRDTTWRVSHPAMYPDPDFAQAQILNDRFVLMDGIVGFTFDPHKAVVYFQPFATDRIFSVTREVLRAGPISINQVLPVKLVGKKSSQGISIAVSLLDGSLIFSPVTETAVASWNPYTNEQHVLAQDQVRLQFVSDMTIPAQENSYVYVISSKFHRFFLKNLNTEEVNNRIIKIPLSGLKATAQISQFPNNYQTRTYPGIPIPVPLNHYYQLTNSIQAKSLNLAPTQGYFTRPSHSNHPYEFDNAGVINYTVKNPFTALNQGETFPPPKALRNQDQFSFLDSLAASAPEPLNSHQPSLPDYFYQRTARATDSASN